MSVYKFLEAFAKLEKRLSEGQEGSAATRGQPSIHDVRSKLDKFIKALGPSEIQVCVSVFVLCEGSATFTIKKAIWPPSLTRKICLEPQNIFGSHNEGTQL